MNSEVRTPPYARPAWWNFIIAMAVVGIYFFSYNNDFVNYDDNVYVTENPVVEHGVTLNGIARAFASPVNAGWNPLAVISHMVDVQIFGMHPGGHHVVSVVLHLLNSLLLFYVLREMTGDTARSGLAGVLFAVLAIHVEPVAWISSRKDVLSTLLMLLTIESYVRNARATSAAGSARTLLWYALALLAKPMVITLPVLLLLLDFWPLRRLGNDKPVLADKRREIVARAVEKLPYFALAVAVSVVTFLAQRAGGAVRDFGTFPLSQRLANAVHSYAMYLSQIFVPRDFAVYYPHPGGSLPLAVVLGCALGLVIASVFALLACKKSPYLTVGWFWYVISLLPVIGIVQIGSFARADRFAYVPSIGIIVMAVWAFNDVVRSRTARVIVPALVIVANMSVAARQVSYWRNSVALFQRAVAVTSGNAVAHNNLGVARLRQANTIVTPEQREAILDDAETQLTEALRIAPDFVDAHSNLGLALLAQGKTGAREHFEKALQLDPRNVKALVNLGNEELAIGKTEAALELYGKAKAIAPDDFDAAYNTGVAYLKMARAAEALKEFQLAVDLRPDSAAAFVQLAAVNLALGKTGEGGASAARAVQLDPRNAEAHYQLGVSFALAGKLEPAEKEYRVALDLKPDHAMAHYNLGAVLGNLGRLDEARTEFERAVQSDPNNAQARQALDMMSRGPGK